MRYYTVTSFEYQFLCGKKCQETKTKNNLGFSASNSSQERRRMLLLRELCNCPNTNLSQSVENETSIERSFTRSKDIAVSSEMSQAFEDFFLLFDSGQNDDDRMLICATEKHLGR